MNVKRTAGYSFEVFALVLAAVMVMRKAQCQYMDSCVSPTITATDSELGYAALAVFAMLFMLTGMLALKDAELDEANA